MGLKRRKRDLMLKKLSMD